MFEQRTFSCLALFKDWCELPLLEKVKDEAERLWYIHQTIEHGWSRNVLVMQIETRLFHRKGNGIDWYRYQKKVLIPKLISFAKECQKDHPNMVVQEDKAPTHNYYAQQKVYDLYYISHLL